MTIVTTTYTLPPNANSYGLSGPIVSGSGGAWYNSAGLSYIYTNGTSYANIIAIKNPCIILPLGGAYYLSRLTSTDYNNATSGAWDGSGWTATSSYTHRTSLPLGIIGVSAWYYAPFYTLGSVKSISMETDSPHDVIGLPGQNETGTLAFDVEGVLMNISVDGAFFETDPQIMSGRISAIKNLMNGNQYVGNPCAFWWDRERAGSTTTAKPYFVSVKKFTYQGTEKDVNKVDYKLQLVVRALAV